MSAPSSIGTIAEASQWRAHKHRRGVRQTVVCSLLVAATLSLDCRRNVQKARRMRRGPDLVCFLFSPHGWCDKETVLVSLSRQHRFRLLWVSVDRRLGGGRYGSGVTHLRLARCTHSIVVEGSRVFCARSRSPLRAGATDGGDRRLQGETGVCGSEVGRGQKYTRLCAARVCMHNPCAAAARWLFLARSWQKCACVWGVSGCRHMLALAGRQAAKLLDVLLWPQCGIL